MSNLNFEAMKTAQSLTTLYKVETAIGAVILLIIGLVVVLMPYVDNI